MRQRPRTESNSPMPTIADRSHASRTCRLEVADELAKERLYAEVRYLANLSHPNIVTYLHYTADAHTISIFMEYAESGTLADAIKSRRGRPFETEQVVCWLVQLTAALEHVHANQLLHRDLKTQNVFLTAPSGGAAWGNVRLGDFGIARALSTYTNFSETLIGTPACMAPEALASAPYSHPADVWGLGIVLFELLTLQRPFGRGNLHAMVSRISKGQYDVAALEKAPHLQELKQLCGSQGLLHVDPDERMRLDELLQVLQDLGFSHVQITIESERTKLARNAPVDHGCVLADPSFYPRAASAQIAELLRTPSGRPDDTG